MEKRSNKESREKEYAKVNIWRMNHPDYKNVNSKQAVDKWRKKVPEASRAYNKIRYAINTGKLIKPNKCEKCGEEKKVAAHHNDYTKPYDIMWLCSKCHKKLHYKYTD
jgi:formylmethanofuran dehydrogenase subunit E